MGTCGFFGFFVFVVVALPHWKQPTPHTPHSATAHRHPAHRTHPPSRTQPSLLSPAPVLFPATVCQCVAAKPDPVTRAHRKQHAWSVRHGPFWRGADARVEIRKSWKSRWFVLYSKSIAYLDKEGGKVKGGILLDEAHMVGWRLRALGRTRVSHGSVPPPCNPPPSLSPPRPFSPFSIRTDFTACCSGLARHCVRTGPGRDRGGVCEERQLYVAARPRSAKRPLCHAMPSHRPAPSRCPLARPPWPSRHDLYSLLLCSS